MNPQSEKPLILLVDDAPANLHVMAAALKADYDIKMVTSGIDALVQANEEVQPQLILLDVMMPGMNGIEVLRHLRENPRTSNIHVIVVSADASEHSQLDGLELGADDYLIKPIQPLVLLARVRNLLQRKRAEAALAQSEALFRTLAESVSVGIYRTDASGKTVYVNDRCCEIIGLDREAVFRDGWMLGLHPDDQAAVLAEWAKTLDSKQAFIAEHRFQSNLARHERDTALSLRPSGEGHGDEGFQPTEGQVRWVINHAQVETNAAGVVIGYVGSITDITERKAAEALRLAKEHAEEISRTKSLFLSRMSHELRTPLNAIIGFAQLMDDPSEPMTDSQRENIDIIFSSGQQLLKMVNEVLELSQLESCEMPLTIESLALRDVVAESINLMETLAENHGVALDLDLGGCADSKVLADRCLLEKCLYKLLSNGVKYNNAQGQLTIRGTVHDGQAYLAISDQGPGISSEQMQRLFLPFERFNGDKWETEDSIGLAVTLRYIELMGGSLNVTSELGVSSTFTLRLPLDT